MKILNLFCCLFLLVNTGLAHAAKVEETFEKLKSSPKELYNFLEAMPKGGDLHYHLDGGVDPEIMLDLAAKKNYCITRPMFKLSKVSPCPDLRVSDLISNPALYEKALAAWSMKYFHPGIESGHDHFFSTFYKFYELTAAYPVPFLATVMQKAAKQNVEYMEIILSPLFLDFSKLPKLKNIEPHNFANLRKLLMEDFEFKAKILKGQFLVDGYENSIKQNLACSSSKNAACNMVVRFQYYVLREQELDKVFINALYGFELASSSKTMLAVNLVQAEDGKISLRDYKKQMEIFAFLHKLYPKVHISLHAGELAPELVSSKDLKFHINDAIFTGAAERIGHGVSISHENSYKELLAYMAKHKIAVEINLSSNKAILEISGKEHPLTMYLKAKVPVVLSTDDEGILLTNLTKQYLEAALVHKLSYLDLKQISRDSLTYSFLPGKSIWSVSACKNLSSPACLEFIKTSEKAKLEHRLELKFLEFEKKFK